jgi:glutamate synthase domain-containing protein 2
MSFSSSDINNLDNFIEQLSKCKPLKETEVKFLCEKVINLIKIGERDFK